MAVHRSLGGRDPLSYPRQEGDDNFIGKREIQVTSLQDLTGLYCHPFLYNLSSIVKKFPFTKNTQGAQSEEPFKRLFNSNTLSSSRHQVFNHDPQAPNDNLDFLLKVKYNQHADILRPLAVTRYQKETFDKDHGRVLKNREKILVIPPPELNHPIRISCDEKRERLEQNKLAIGSRELLRGGELLLRGFD